MSAGMKTMPDGSVVAWYGEEVAQAVDHAKRTALESAGMIVANVAIAKAPKKTGLLKEEIRVFVPDKGKETGDTVYVGSDLIYSLYQEKGWRQGGVHHPGKPFLRPALDENRDRVVKIIGEILGKAAEAGGKR